MYASTHKIIADIVCGYIQDELGVTLDLKAFRYGSIAPDIKLGMRIMKHTREGSFDLVKKTGYGLIKMEDPSSQFEMKDFSYKLGIIIHFLCDYFSTPHNDEKYKNIIKHLKYEKRLEKYALKRENWNISTLNEAIVNKKWNNTSFEQIILDKTIEYNKISSGFSSDMEFAITVSTMATLNIVKKSMAQNKNSKFQIAGINLIPA